MPYALHTYQHYEGGLPRVSLSQSKSMETRLRIDFTGGRRDNVEPIDVREGRGSRDRWQSTAVTMK